MSAQTAAPRTVTLVLLDEAGTLLGALPPFPVEMPYWPEAWDIVEGARARFGVDLAVLRLLHADPPVPHGGSVTYLAQTDSTHTNSPHTDSTQTNSTQFSSVLTAVGPRSLVDLAPHPRRAPYAEPGGPAESLRWAAAALALAGRDPVLATSQRRTWNLSAIWRLDTPDGPCWLKQVPHFFTHEPAVLQWIAASGAGHLVPRVIAAEAGRMLVDHVPGEDRYGASAPVRDAIAADMHRLQVHAAGHIEELLDTGMPDRRGPRLAPIIRTVVDQYGGADPRLRSLVDGLDERLARIAACGLPDTLVHGDLHPGNVHATVDPGPGSCVIIDWGDSAVGNPAFDILRLIDDLDGTAQSALLRSWADRWRSAIPDCDPLRAVQLLRPVVALQLATVYALFLDHIEPSEHPYHAADVPTWLARAAALA